MFSFLSKYLYSRVERLINKKISNAEMKHYIIDLEIGKVEFWDNEVKSDLSPVILVHGLGAEGKYQWFTQLSTFKNRRVILLNLNYFGNTYPKKPMYEIKHQVQLLESLLFHLNLNKVNLLGASYGGLVSFEYARLNSGKIEKLVVIGSPIKFMTEEDLKKIISRFKVNALEDIFVPKDVKGLKRLWYIASGKKNIFPNFLLTVFVERMYQKNREEKYKVIQKLVENMEKYAKQEYHFDFPVLLLWGANDIAVPVEKARLLKRYLGDNCRLEVIQNGGHMVHLNKFKKSAKLLREFICE